MDKFEVRFGHFKLETAPPTALADRGQPWARFNEVGIAETGA